MTIGTAMVAKMKVRSTGDRVRASHQREVENGQGREDRQPDHEGELVLARRARQGWRWG